LSSGCIALIKAQTSLHCGAGTALGGIDLPIQREKHTGWPMIQSSGLKGGFRDCMRAAIASRNNSTLKDADKDERLRAIFGPPTSEASEHAGALTVTDARILLFPVRSAKGVFAWVTCPSVLKRLKGDLAMVNCATPWNAPWLESGAPTAIPTGASRDHLGLPPSAPSRVVIEEFTLSLDDNGTTDALAEWLQSAVPNAHDLPKHLLVIADDWFGHLTRFATEVITRIALDYEKKTVSGGALFNEELLPPETVLYTILLAADARGGKMKAAEVLEQATDNIHGKLLQIGGDETTGKGLCWLSVLPCAADRGDL
jgi:CRISPR-associated protein Cmr4